MIDSPETDVPIEAHTVSDRHWAVTVGVIAVVLSSIPYLIGYSFAQGRSYMWLGYNIDDSCVYLAWMRQAFNGSFRAYNLFTTASQHGMTLNPLFLVLGWVSRILHLPLIAVYQLARVVTGFIMLMVVWKLIYTVILYRFARRLAFLFVCFSSGLGWLPLWWVDTPGAVPILRTPVDAWQPEAITFLSLYLSPLFCVSLALQVGILLQLLQARRTGRLLYAVIAGVMGLILALVHTYDVASLTLVWIFFLIVANLTSARTYLKRDLAQAATAGAITLPGVAYIGYLLHSETVFRNRADVATLSPPLAYILLGYGLTLILALIAVYLYFRHGKQRAVQSPSPDSHCGSSPAEMWNGSESFSFVTAWASANLAAAYLPTAFQRKMLQGEHFAIALLAGVGAALLLNSLKLKFAEQYRLITGLAITLLLSITNIRFVLRDIIDDENNLAQTGTHRPYLKPGEIEALTWIDQHTPREVAIQPLPYVFQTVDENGHGHIGPSDVSLACFAPGLTGRHVYCGHFGETPDYGTKLSELVRLALPTTSDEMRRTMLRKMKVGYLIFSQKEAQDDAADQLAPMFRGNVPLPDYLHRVYSNRDADVYRIDDAVSGVRTDRR